MNPNTLFEMFNLFPSVLGFSFAFCLLSLLLLLLIIVIIIIIIIIIILILPGLFEQLTRPMASILLPIH